MLTRRQECWPCSVLCRNQRTHWRNVWLHVCYFPAWLHSRQSKKGPEGVHLNSANQYGYCTRIFMQRAASLACILKESRSYKEVRLFSFYISRNDMPFCCEYWEAKAGTSKQLGDVAKLNSGRSRDILPLVIIRPCLASAGVSTAPNAPLWIWSLGTWLCLEARCL